MYDAEIKYIQKLLQQFHLNSHIISQDSLLSETLDLGIRTFLNIEKEYTEALHSFLQQVQSNIIYKISDDFFCNYIIMQLPETERTDKTFFIIGPYIARNLSKQDIFKEIEKFQVPPKLTERLMQFFASIPLITDSTIITAVTSAFGETLWGSTGNYTIKSIIHSRTSGYTGTIPAEIMDSINEQKDISFKMKLLENRYSGENRFMNYIAQGNYQKAEISFDSCNLFDIENRVADPVRNFKNYCISMNTILRKAAEYGDVHPIHIDKISSFFVRKVENLTSVQSGRKLMKEMIRKYGLLVKNYSMKDYSFLVQKVITRIESDLAADQSLNAHAEILNVSPSYLSTLFRKETGVTLTEFVNRKRVEYGIFLLNTTNMQIQTIAQHCGISDINYFSRIFKKYIGKTPKEYRNSISS